MNNPIFLVSIIIPSYNMEEYIGKNLRHLVEAQHINQVEIIVVNDGSKDKTSAIAHNFQQEHPNNIIVIDKENAHYGSCINAALAIARGKYFRILDADDWIEADALDSFVEKLETCNADLVVTLRTEIILDKNGQWTQKNFPIRNIEYGKIYDARSFAIRDYSKKVEFNMHSMTYKTEILRQVRLVLPTGICYTDLLYCLVPLSHIKDLVVFDIYLYNYLTERDGNSTSNAALKRNLSHISTVLLTMFKYLDRQDSKILTPAIISNQLRYIDEALTLCMQSIRMHHSISKDEYPAIDQIMDFTKKYHIKNKFLKKYYFRIWRTRQTRSCLNCMLKWYHFIHPSK